MAASGDAAFVVSRAARRRHEQGPADISRAREIVGAIRRWHELYGEPPMLADWEPSRARQRGQDWRAERWESGHWPSTRQVRAQFGTMSAAVRAAGLVPRRSPTRTRRHLESPQAVLEAIQEWERRHGEPPGMADWDPARARGLRQDWRTVRFYEGDWPSIVTVKHHFGTLNRAIAAAGLRPRVRGERTVSGRLRSAATDGPRPARHQQVLASRVRSVADAANSDDTTLLAEALKDLAVTALGWADEVQAGGG
jgi:hypothetical protein